MAITKEEIKGTHIICEIKSSNIKGADYDTESKNLIIEFNNNSKYEYLDVPLNVFTAMRRAESQGSFFSKQISKNFKYKKL